MTKIYEIADDYVERVRRARPDRGDRRRHRGPRPRAHRLSRPPAPTAAAALDRETLAALDAEHAVAGDRDRIAAEMMRERLELAVSQHEPGRGAARPAHHRAARCSRSASASTSWRYDTADDWAVVAERMTQVPDVARELPSRARRGRAHAGSVAARRQALGVRGAGRDLGRPHAPTSRSSARSPRGYDSRATDAAARRSSHAADDATAAYAEIARVAPRRPTRPSPTERDAVGAERYRCSGPPVQRHRARSRRDLRVGLGGAVPHRARDARGRASASSPAKACRAVLDYLEHDEHRAIEGVDEFQQWNQELIDRTIAELNGTHFDIAEPLRRCEAMIAPPGGERGDVLHRPERRLLAARSHVVPDAGQDPLPAVARSVDLLPRGGSRPSPAGRAGAYLAGGAEPVPAHRRASSPVTAKVGRSTPSGSWASSATSTIPRSSSACSRAQAMRAVRVIVDIGMHLELPIPDRERYHPGERWNAEHRAPVRDRALVLPRGLHEVGGRPLPRPGRARRSRYKVGERVWLEARADAQARKGDAFDLKAFHSLRARPRRHGPRPAPPRARPLLARARSALLGPLVDDLAFDDVG